MSDPLERSVNVGPEEMAPDRRQPGERPLLPGERLLLPGERPLWSARPGRVPVPWPRVARKAMSLMFDICAAQLAQRASTAARSSSTQGATDAV